jgi:ribosomal protein S18 acetylase RimI-like enzyme
MDFTERSEEIPDSLIASRFSYSRADKSNIQELSDLVNSAYRGESSRVGWTTEADFMDGFRTDPKRLASELAASPYRAILYLREISTGSIAGCVFLEQFQDENGMGCHLGMLTVKPTLQDQGLGRTLLELAETYARDSGASKISLGVIHLRETLMAWYERRGYSRTGKTKPFPYDELTTDVPKRDDLCFVLFEKAI